MTLPASGFSQQDVRDEFKDSGPDNLQGKLNRMRRTPETNDLQYFGSRGRSIPTVNTTFQQNEQISIVGRVDANGDNAIGEVQYRPLSGTFSRVGTTWSVSNFDINSASRTQTGLTPNTTYEFRVRSYNGFNEDPLDWDSSAIIQRTTTLDNPTVTTLAPTNIGETSVTLRMGIGDVSGFTVRWFWRYRVQGTFSWTNTATTTGGGGDKSRFQGGLTAGTTYEKQAAARNDTHGGDYQFGSIVTFTTSTLSPDPTNVSWIASGNFAFVGWDTPEKGNPSSYTINVTVGFSTSTVVTGLSGASTSYNFNVCLYGNNNDSSYVTVIKSPPTVGVLIRYKYASAFLSSSSGSPRSSISLAVGARPGI